MSLYFRKLRYKNFLSTGNLFTEINFTSNKTTLIIGTNGSGKSTFIDALTYVLYGKAYRNINIPQLVNAISGKKMLVEVEFNVSNNEYLVRRGIKPNIFEIYKNGDLIPQDSTIKDYQKQLEEYILKIGLRSFKQIVVLGSAGHVPFMQLKAYERREVIEDLLDIQIFSLMNAILKDRISQNKENINSISTQLKIIETKIEMIEKHISEINENNQNMILEKEKNKQKYEKENVILTKKIDSLLNSISKIKLPAIDFTEKMNQLNNYRAEFSFKKNNANSEISFFAKNDTCPTCHQDIKSDFKSSYVRAKTKELKALEEKIQKANDKYNILIKEIAKVDEGKKKISEIQQNITALKNDIARNNHSIKEIEAEISSLQHRSQEKSSKSKELDEFKTSRRKLCDEKFESVSKYEILSAAGFLLKDGGIKTQIVRQYVPVINKLISKYLAAMDFFVQFELDENFNETIKSRYRDDFSYESFSEGEKFRIDLALLFTWRAIAKLRNSSTCNILILDEIFDSSLDLAGTDEFLKILETITEDTNVFVISHRMDSLADKFDNVIKFEKTKNFSKLLENA